MQYTPGSLLGVCLKGSLYIISMATPETAGFVKGGLSHSKEDAPAETKGGKGCPAYQEHAVVSI